MVEFHKDGKNGEAKYSFTDFDERVGKVFETACRQLYETIKGPILQDCKTLRSIIDEVAAQEEFYGKTYDSKELFCGYAEDDKMHYMERELAREFSNFIFNFYKKECFPRGVMNDIQKLGNEGRDKIEKKLAERKGYTRFNREFHKSFLAFEDIVRFDGRSIQKILRDISNYDLGIALKNTSDTFKKAISCNMSKRAEQWLYDYIDDLGPVLKRQVQECRQKILRVMEDLYSCHELVWNDEWTD